MSKGRGGHPKEPTSQSWNNLSDKINNIVLDHSPKYEINMREPTLIYTNTSISKWRRLDSLTKEL